MQTMLKNKENWKPVKNYETKYLISNMGRVKSLAGKRGAVKDLILSLYEAQIGYFVVNLHDGKKQEPMVYVHRLVAYHFLPNPLNFPEINHIDGVKTNNKVSNLEWCTRSHNIKHAYRIGLKKPYDMRGENNPSSKLTNESVIEIRSRHDEGILSYRELAEMYQVTETTISNAVSRKTWKYV